MATGLFNLKQVNQAISQGAWSGYIAPRWVEYLVVAGGGSGGVEVGSNVGAGGGGAGGLLTGIVTVTSGTSYTVTVGAGGAAVSASTTGNTGVASVFGVISASGGGGGASTGVGNNALSGGSGGGGANQQVDGPTYPNGNPGSGISGQGNAGGAGYGNGSSALFGPGGGGGGAGTIGLTGLVTVAGNGGAGIASAISGTVTTYAGGGGGSHISTSTAGTGGVGGGGAGGAGASGTNGSANTGGGGGAMGRNGSTSGAGGSGIVVVRYPGNVQFYTGGTVTYSNGYIVHNFTANGTLAPTTPTVVSEYQISRSLRFNSADSPYLSRTPSTTSSQTTATFSAWVKRSRLGSAAENRMFAESTGSGAGLFWVIFTTSDQLQVLVNGSGTNITSTQVFRDPSAWYHIVAAVDTNQAIGTDRIKLYVNGTQITAFTGTQTYYTQGQLLKFNVTSTTNYIGYNNSQAFDGYMTEVNWIDGQQLTPTSFGYVNPTTGIWSPAKFVGAYGTNGFYLNFSDNSNTTAATLGADYSGNGNNWTPNGFSISTGIGDDSLVDSPTSYGTDTGVGGTVRGNYATLNPLLVITTSGVTTPTLANGNLNFVGNLTTDTSGRSTIGVTSGKWYCEVKVSYVSAAQDGLGIAYTQSDSSRTLGVLYRSSGDKCVNNTVTSYGTNYVAGSLIGIALDADANTVTFYNTNVSQGSISFTPTTAIYFSTYGTNASPAFAGDINFGQRPFVYTAPSGFKALCTQNLPTPTIGATTATQAGKFFNPVLYTGTGANGNAITGVGFQPDWTWLKGRSNAQNHGLFDAVRGAGKGLQSNSTGAEYNLPDTLNSFNTDGFTVNNDSTFNGSGNTYVAWNWKANGSGSTNTAGSITSTVSANTTSGFSVVTYTGTGANATVGHGLGVAPSMVIYKNRTSNSTWIVYHASISPTNLLVLNESTAQQNIPAYFNSSATTSSVLSIGSNSDMNASGASQLAYCFAPVAGFSAFGSYTGNGSTDGPFVFTGMRPAFVMIKRSSGAENWYVYDVARGTYNVIGPYLQANLSSAESTGTIVDFLSNGFKIRESGAGTNTSSSTYIYMAFASNPFKTSLAR